MNICKRKRFVTIAKAYKEFERTSVFFTGYRKYDSDLWKLEDLWRLPPTNHFGNIWNLFFPINFAEDSL